MIWIIIICVSTFVCGFASAMWYTAKERERAGIWKYLEPNTTITVDKDGKITVSGSDTTSLNWSNGGEIYTFHYNDIRQSNSPEFEDWNSIEITHNTINGEPIGPIVKYDTKQR